MAKKNALGRGLGALIEQEEKVEKVGSINEIEIEKIEANPYQPRTQFDEESLNELAESIKQLGIIQPVTVRPVDDNKYQLITGERRFRACKLAGLEKIPAYIRPADNQGMLEMALVENIQREDLDAIEVALSYQQLIEECKITQENLSERVGKKRSTITNYLRLLRLPAEIQLGIRNRKVSMGHARTLISVDDPETQLMIYQQILKYDFSVRKTEEIVRELAEKQEETEKEKKPAYTQPEEYSKLEDHLARHFDTKVQFKKGASGKGKIIIPFKNDDDLERIIAIIDKINL
jgi:ParB family transcriptional regulator, chromosome partitioning protein